MGSREALYEGPISLASVALMMGLEPTTFRSTGGRSDQTELHQRKASPTGFEPVTSGFVDQRAIQLRYGELCEWWESNPHGPSAGAV